MILNYSLKQNINISEAHVHGATLYQLGNTPRFRPNRIKAIEVFLMLKSLTEKR